MADSTAYGEWPSPVAATDVASGGREFGALATDDGEAYWLERRPSEDGRGVVVREGDGDGPVDVTPDDVDVRTLVHEYGGGDFAVRDGTVWYVDFDDQRVYRQPVPDGPDAAPEPEPVTPEPPEEHALRYADFEVAPDGEHLYCVRERHGAARPDPEEDDLDDEQPVNELVVLPADGSAAPRVVASGQDFYASPRLSPEGDRLAWLTWDHPRMPWDGTVLHVAEVDDDGGLSDERELFGDEAQSLFQPEWSPDGVLHVVSDRSGHWNVYRLPDVDVEEEEFTPFDPLYPGMAEFGAPMWQLGYATYGFLDDGRIACVVTEDGSQRLALLAAEGGLLHELELPYTSFRPPLVRTDGDAVTFVAATPTEPSSVVRVAVDGDRAEASVLRRGETTELDERYVSTPEHVTYPTGDDAEAHLLYYPPTNPDVEAPEGERPPLVVTCHGGPTSARYPAFDLETQFWTTRGFAVADVNYRGSTGYGREYRQALYGEWGEVDVLDCVNAARHLVEEGRVDGDRLAVSGGSAGGFVVLSALSGHDVFDAGASYYGVADLERLAAFTHKFESHYLAQLVGPLPEAEDVYRERSPVHGAEGIDVPVLLLQGEDDPVVPLDQAETMVDALAEAGTPHEYVVFEGERHGFRRAESRERALSTELGFYAGVFGFEPAGDVEPVVPDAD